MVEKESIHHVVFLTCMKVFLGALRHSVIHVPPPYQHGCVALLAKTRFNSGLNLNYIVFLEFGQQKTKEMEELDEAGKCFCWSSETLKLKKNSILAHLSV